MGERAPQVVHLDGENDVGLADDGAAKTLVERMPRRKIHAAGIVDDGALQGLGKFD